MNASIRPHHGLLGRGPQHAAAWAERELRSHGVPPEEVREILATDDPRVVRRRLELHRERLVEELIDRNRTLAALERDLTVAAVERAAAIGRASC